jgi:hypothetical protein
MSELMITATQTPIEVLLQVDSDGTVSARNVYDFLELHPAHYAKWCRINITENEYAEENADFLVSHLRVKTPQMLTMRVLLRSLVYENPGKYDNVPLEGRGQKQTEYRRRKRLPKHLELV